MDRETHLSLPFPIALEGTKERFAFLTDAEQGNTSRQTGKCHLPVQAEYL